ncbi:hypothetical protein MBOL_04170 [Mycobacteroides abscessus subsp. bolletii BD]|nr:hypothetical protein MBOL_04170 [Mycobacteroides abscessus subsp. bolletii BD]SKS40574.1 Uncharacterised protein [Mycobacteroides abscessus subsp. abscessus]
MVGTGGASVVVGVCTPVLGFGGGGDGGGGSVVVMDGSGTSLGPVHVVDGVTVTVVGAATSVRRVMTRIDVNAIASTARTLMPATIHGHFGGFGSSG